MTKPNNKIMEYKNIEFTFPLYLSEKKEEKGRFIFEGFAAANDFDLQNDIISDKALRKCIEDFKKEGKFCLNHTEEVIGKILDCHFRKGKIWVRTEVTKKRIIDKVKSGELNCLSIKGRINRQEKVELFPDLRLTLIKDLHLEEVSLVPKGANPEAKAIRWYVKKAIEMAEKNMSKKIKKNLEEVKKDIDEKEEEEEKDEEEKVESNEEENEKDDGVGKSEEDDEENEDEENEDDEEDEDKDEDEEESEENEDEENKEDDNEKAEEEEKKEDEKEEETEKGEGIKKAVWNTAYINDLPDSSFAYIEAGGKKDNEGRTAPRSLRHLPYKDASGKIDLPHLRNAIARASHVKDKDGKNLSDAIVSKIQAKLQKLLESAKKDLSVTYRESEKNLSEEKKNKEEKIVYQVMNSADIQLKEKKDLSEFKKELLRVGTWKHDASKDGVLNVTKEMLKTIIKNFKDKVLDNVFVPLGHPASDDPSKNTGEVVDLEMSKDENKLMATVDIKDKEVVGKIDNGLIKGISASFVEDYMKKDTGKKVGTTLFHAALVTEPYIKGMDGFVPVPLSEELKGSLVIPIFNMESPLALNELTSKVKKIETKLNEKNETRLEKKESSEKEETESPEVGEKAEDKGKEEETETEAESAENKGVDLADADRVFEELLGQGKVTPAQKDLLLPLLSSDAKIELSEGKKVELRKVLIEYLKKESPKFPLSEEGTSETPKKEKKEEKIPSEINDAMEKMDLSEDIREETYNEFKKRKEGEKKEESSTPF